MFISCHMQASKYYTLPQKLTSPALKESGGDRTNNMVDWFVKGRNRVSLTKFAHRHEVGGDLYLA